MPSSAPINENGETLASCVCAVSPWRDAQLSKDQPDGVYKRLCSDSECLHSSKWVDRVIKPMTMIRLMCLTVFIQSGINVSCLLGWTQRKAVKIWLLWLLWFFTKFHSEALKNLCWRINVSYLRICGTFVKNPSLSPFMVVWKEYPRDLFWGLFRLLCKITVS